MNVRLTAAMLVVLALLGGAVWYFELRNPPAADPKAADNVVLDLKAEDVTRVEVVDAGKSTAVERGEDGQWTIVQPPTDQADGRRIEDGVGRIAKLTATRRLEEAADLESYGLANPTTRIELETKDGATRQLLVGARTPDNTGFYVKLADSPAVYVVSTFVLTDLTRWASEPPTPRPTPTPLPSPAAKP